MRAMGHGLVLVSGLLSSAFGWSGCGVRASPEAMVLERCEPGRATCLSSQLGQICHGQGQWGIFQCASDQQCSEGACVRSQEACAAGAATCLSPTVGQICGENGRWSPFACDVGQVCQDGRCRSDCSADAHECATERTQRICSSDGSGWVTSECPSGLACANGECIGTCQPGRKECAATRVVRECRSDGSGYVEQVCPQDTSCWEGTCVPDTTNLCMGWMAACLDEQTALVCAADASGYEEKACSEGTRCSFGRCWGPVCAAGESNCTTSDVSNLKAVLTCSEDGAAFIVTLCRAGEQCVVNYETARGECYLPPCSRGAAMCGDPASATSSTEVLSRCEYGSDGKLGWIPYRCSAPTACFTDDSGTTGCHADCAPGDRRCSQDGNAIESCQEDGSWSAATCAAIGGVAQACVVVPTTYQVVCGDPDCRALQGSLRDYRARGRCSGELIRRCGDDGKLQAAAACDEGMCLPETDGFGSCKNPARCNQADGWRECVTDNDAYRTCLSNHWEFTLCPAGQTCSDDGKGQAVCGDDCYAGARRCSGAEYQVCSEQGSWGPVTPCDSGECNPTTKRCESACQPGQIRCVGDVVLASDFSSLGSTGMQVCLEDGGWGSTQACATAAGQYCRRSANGVHLGCVECVGSRVTGGNEEGAVDSRCAADGSGYMVCQEDNAWPAVSSACEAGERCAKRRDGTLRASCSNDGCSTDSSRRCLGYKTLETPVTITDCCAGDCQSETSECWHRRDQYDPDCLETTLCPTGRYDTENNPIEETCCNGYCKSGQGCLKLKGQPCTSVTSCTVSKLGQSTVCCGSCQTDGTCPLGREAEHPVGEYFACGSSSTLCWSLGACSWTPSSASGAMFANCVSITDGG